ncbi:MAG: hypothetical protein KC466_09720 [Myxococcales bacterium]|nr:hypothetical protein [Myxococcales bacterium]
MKSPRSSLSATILLATLAGCGGGGGTNDTGGGAPSAAAPFSAVAQVLGDPTASVVNDIAPAAVTDGNYVLVRGDRTIRYANGNRVEEVFVLFPMPAAPPALYSFDDPLLGGARVYGRFDILEGGVRDQHESVRAADQPEGSGYVLVTHAGGDRVAGSFSFRARVLGDHPHGAGAKHGDLGGGGEHGDEILDVTGAFDVTVTEGEVDYPRLEGTVAPPEGGAWRVEVGFTHHVYPLPMPAVSVSGPTRSFTNDQGVEFVLTDGALRIDKVALIPCGADIGGHEDAAAKHGEGDPGEESPLGDVSLPFDAAERYVADPDIVAHTRTYEVPNQAYCGARIVVGGGTEDLRFAGTCGGVAFSFAGTLDAPVAVEHVIHVPAEGGNVEGELVPSETLLARTDVDEDEVPDLIFGNGYNLFFNGLTTEDCAALGAGAFDLAAQVAEVLTTNHSAIHQHLGPLAAIEER